MFQRDWIRYVWNLFEKCWSYRCGSNRFLFFSTENTFKNSCSHSSCRASKKKRIDVKHRTRVFPFRSVPIFSQTNFPFIPMDTSNRSIYVARVEARMGQKIDGIRRSNWRGGGEISGFVSLARRQHPFRSMQRRERWWPKRSVGPVTFPRPARGIFLDSGS